MTTQTGAERSSPDWRLVFVGGAAFVVRLTTALWLGPLEPPDARIYWGLAGELLGRIPPGGAFPEVSYEIFYRGYPTLLAVVTVLIGRNSAPTVMVCVQALLSACSSLALYRLVRLQRSRVAWAAALAAGYGCLPELATWDRVLSSDSFNLSLLVFALHEVVKELRTGTGARMRLGLLLVLLAVTRPTNLVFLAVSSGALAVTTARSRSRATLRLGAATLAAAAVVAAIATGTRVYGTTPFGRFSQRLWSGKVINDRPGYDVPSQPESDPSAFAIRVVARRAALFWSLWFEGFSLRHRVVNALTLAPLFLAALLGLRSGLRSPELRPSLLYLATLVVAYTATHALTMVDYDLRYRLVVFPALFGLAAPLGRDDRERSGVLGPLERRTQPVDG